MARLIACVSLVLVVVTSSAAHAQTPEPTAPPTSRPVVHATSGPTLLWPTTAPSDTVDHPILRRGRDMGLISTGIVGLSLGMMVGILMASFDLAGGNCESFRSTSFGFTFAHVQCDTAPFALIPIAGSILVGTTSFDGNVTSGMVIAGVLAAAPQIAGLVFLLVGMHGFTEDLDGDIRLRVDPIVGSSQLGAQLTVEL